MIKLYVDVYGGINDDSMEFEISNELAELLRHWSLLDRWNELSEEERTCDQFNLDIYCKDLDELINNNEGVSEHVLDELKVIANKADSKGDELAVASFLETDPPTEFFFEEKMPKDLEAGLFTPSESFEQFLEEFLEDYDLDSSDEEYDEEYAQEEAQEAYYEMIYDEYRDWVETLPTYERASRYNLEYDAPIPDHDYTLVRINKTAE